MPPIYEGNLIAHINAHVFQASYHDIIDDYKIWVQKTLEQWKSFISGYLNT